MPTDRAGLERVPLAFAVASLALHLLPTLLGGYGYFRDELYYIACCSRPDLGYVDHPPLSIWLLGAWRAVFGESLFALRFPPALAGAVMVYLAGVQTKFLGGGRFAQSMAGLAVMLSPVLLGMTGIYNMNPFDILVWQLAFLLLCRLTVQARAERWLVLGLVLGLGLLNKVSVLWLGFGIFLGMLCTVQRNWLRTRWPYVAASVALLVFLPYMIWNVRNDFAHLEFMRNAASEKYASQNPLSFLTALVMSNNPLAMPLWLGGLWFLFRNLPFRLLGWIAFGVAAVLIVNVHSKGDYYAPVMPLLFAAGAVQYERLARGHALLVRYSYPAVVAATGILLIPLTLAVLPPELYFRYQTALGIPQQSVEGQELSGFPQHYADRFGWEEMTAEVARVFATLPAEEQKNCIVLTTNYGQAGALEFFGKRFKIPAVLCQHNSYYLWGLREYRNETVFIVLRHDEADLRESFESVERCGTIYHPFAMPYENGNGVWICRGLKQPFEKAWEGGKMYI